MEKPKAEESGLVEVTMKLRVPEVKLTAITKANNRDDVPHIDHIRVAVFGTSGYPQTYAYAEPVNKVVGSDGKISWTPGSYASTNYDPETGAGIYYFKVLLPVYEGACNVHVIANGDENIPFVEQDESSIMASMKTKDNVGAYWARVNMPDGILTIKDENGIMQTNENGNFIPSDKTAALFEDLVLVRNFAEVVISNKASDFEPIAWTLINVPVTGSVAPMEGVAFIDDYKDYRYNVNSGLMEHSDGRKYRGYMVDETIEKIKGSITDDDIDIDIDDPGFLYERVYDDTKPTAILLKGIYKNDPTATYYRIDLMDEKAGGYFPIFRNYKYQIKINKVGNRGAETINEALERNSGGNVSYSAEAKTLTDISDGTSRLFVDYVGKTFTNADIEKNGEIVEQVFSVYYVPDVTDKNVDGSLKVDNSSIKVTLKEPNEAINGSIILDEVNSSVDGKYYYKFKLNKQHEEKDLTSVFEVKASNNAVDEEGNPDEENLSNLYRSVTVTVVKRMDMNIFLKPKKAEGEKFPTVLHIAFTDPLPESMFPLIFYIEDVNHTLNPTGYDGNSPKNKITVPVQTGSSLADGKTNSFYFIRTVNYKEYEPMYEAWKAAQEDEEGGDDTGTDPENPDEVVYPFDFTTEFQTIKSASATTVYVDNEYFEIQSTNLLNDGIYVNPQKKEVEHNVTSVVISVDVFDETKTWTAAGDSDSDVTVSTTGVQTGPGTFTMSFDENDSFTEDVIRRATVTAGGVVHNVTVTQKHRSFSITPDTQLVAYDATSAKVKVVVEDGVVWSASVDNGAKLSVDSGTPAQTIENITGAKIVTVSFDANDNNDRKSYQIAVTASSNGQTANKTATIVQRFKPHEVSRTIQVNTTNFTNYAYSGTYSGELGISFGNVAGDNQGLIYLNRTNGTITVKSKSISSITISYYRNNYAATSMTATAGTVSGGTSWSDNTGNVDEVTLTLYRGNNYIIPTSMEIEYTAVDK